MLNGKKLRQLRKEQRWTIRALAKKVGIADFTLIRYERGIRDPQTSVVRRLEKVLGLAKGELIRE